MNLYLLLKTDISEGSDYRPICIGAYDSDDVARNKALHVLEDFDAKHNTGFDEDELRASDGIHGIQLNIVPMLVAKIELTIPNN